MGIFSNILNFSYFRVTIVNVEVVDLKKKLHNVGVMS